jgi:hypothetical protein
MDDDLPCRPRDFANLMLAGPGLRTRQRARDQQADQAGLELKRRVLVQLAALDPDPQSVDVALEQIIMELGPPYGPTRSICLSVRSDWETACSAPQFVAWLLQEAVNAEERPRRGKQRAD